METNTSQDAAQQIYMCERCGHDTKTKSNLLQHLRRNKPCETTNSTREREIIINDLLKTQDNILPYRCEYCDRGLNSSASKCQHKKVCRYKPDNLPHVVKSIEDAVKDIQAQCQVFDRLIKVCIQKTEHVAKQQEVIEQWVGCKLASDEYNVKDDDNLMSDEDGNDDGVYAEDDEIEQVEQHSSIDNTDHNCETKKPTQDRHQGMTYLEDKMLNSLHKLLPLVMDKTLNKYQLKIVKCTEKSKKSIRPRVRRQVWDTHIGEDVAVSKCMCCEDIRITQHNYICGHVIADSNGGTLDIENLRPICAVCNDAMGNENMAEYKMARFGTTLN